MIHHQRLVGPTLALGLTLSAGAAPAQLTPLGSELQVNSFTTGRQGNPDVGSAGNGNFVVVWDSQGDDVDTSNASIQAQRFSASGVPLGAEQLVNSYTSGNQLEPAVAVANDGAFVTVWASYGSSGSDSSSFSIQGQRTAADGTPFGGEFQVNTYTSGYQTTPDVAADGNGNFVVVWENDGNGSVRARRFDSSGTALGSDFEITDSGEAPQVARNSSGEFLVAWYGMCDLPCTDSLFDSVSARLYDSSGNATTGAFQVNTYTTSQQQRPAVAPLADGNFIVVWDSIGSSGSDSDIRSVQGQRITPAGAFLGGEFQVNTYTTSYQDFPAVAADGSGNFAVVWESRGSLGSDTDLDSVHLRVFDSSGNPAGGDFQVNTYTVLFQDLPSVAVSPAGMVVAVWRSDGSAGGDDSQESVQVQRLANLIFADGFESGTTVAWSTQSP